MKNGVVPGWILKSLTKKNYLAGRAENRVFGVSRFSGSNLEANANGNKAAGPLPPGYCKGRHLNNNAAFP